MNCLIFFLKLGRIMVRTRGLGRAIGRVVGRDRAADEDAGDVPERRRPTASARRLRVHQMTTEGRDMAEDVVDMTDDVPEQPTEAPEMRADAQGADSGEGSDGDDAAEGFPGGPRDPSVLTSFAEHVAHAVWSGQVYDEFGYNSLVFQWKDVETMIESFQQQQEMSVLELYVEKDVASGSRFLSANFVTSCGNNLSNNELEQPRNLNNLDDDEDDDDDYLVSNSYVEESIDEDDSVDGISDTDDEIIDMIQPVTIVHPREGVEGIQNPFWNDSHPDEEDSCGLEMPSSFNIGKELYVGMDFDNSWRVTQWAGPHTCLNMTMTQDHEKVDSNLITTCVVALNLPIRFRTKKAWLAKQKVIAIEYGDWEESYAELLSWLKHMQNHSPGSYFQILHDDFIVGNTSIIQVDDTHLYGKYRETLLMATSQDENGGVLPLAFVTFEGETLTAWLWFLAHLREHVTDKNGICLIFDRHPSIKSVVANEALGWQPPHGYHVYCTRHIASNFNRKFNNVKQKEMLKKLGYTPCKHIFDENLENFCQLSSSITTSIDRFSKEKWTMTYDKEGRRYDHMTTNLSECVNKVLKDCRNIPITTLVKSTYNRCQKYFVDRGRQAQRQLNEGQVYCSKVVKELQKNQEQVCSHIVCVYDIYSTRFEYSTLHYPCSHIIAACGYVSINYFQYVDVVYTNKHILKAYSAQWWPLGNEESIPPSDDSWTLILDPTTICAKGRPKSTRIRNEMD
ncbi:hypothetical protein HKD37_13G038388 [Glycine soja]